MSRAGRGLLLAGLLALAPAASATNGYFMMGYGSKSIAMGGTGIAFAQDNLTGAINPAGFADLDDSVDAGMRALFGFREAGIDCTGVGGCDRAVSDRSNRDAFAIPNFGYSRDLGERFRLGVTVYGNGGIVTSYGQQLYGQAQALILGLRPGDRGYPLEGKLGADFSQLMLAPSLAFRLNERHRFGASLILAVQRFTVTGLRGFEYLSTDPTSVSNRGTEYMIGAGFRFGWMGELLPGLNVGLQYTSRIELRDSVEYNGLLAKDGKVDIPAHYGVGIAWQVTEGLLLAADVHQIQYGTVDALGNPGPTTAELLGFITPERRLGGPAGIGFGWRNQTVFKLGLRWRASRHLTLRLGYNHGESQIPNDQTLFNLISPATINDHLTLGASYAIGDRTELSFGFMHAFKRVNRDRDTALFGADARGWIMEHAMDLSWSRRF